MTETTNIDALRERMMQQREAELTGKTPTFEECELLVCDLLRALTLSNNQLEAERQRTCEMTEQYLDRNSALSSAALRYEKAEKEIAALRGTQEPVAWRITTSSGDVVIHREEQDLAAHSYYGNIVEPLFTRQPKPVVVLPAKSSHSLSASSNHRSYGDGFNKALEKIRPILESAGIVVKDAELDTKPARISVIGSYENSSGGLSSIVTLAEHKGVGMCLVCEGKHPPGLPCPSMKVMSGIENNDGE
jgi:hypothetical protein